MGLRLENGQIVDSNRPKAHASFYEHARRVSMDKWESVIYVTLKLPSCRDSVSREATDNDKLLYADAWGSYQRGAEANDSGTPLGQLPANKSAFEMELRTSGIDTVELLAALDESPAEYMTKLWKQAKMFIELEKLDAEEV